MAVSFTDMDVLRENPTFRSRVRMALVEGAVGVVQEASTVAFHKDRANYAVQILASGGESGIEAFAAALATNSTVINSATATGSVALTPANVETQQALATDANIRTGLNAVFNAFYRQ